MNRKTVSGPMTSHIFSKLHFICISSVLALISLNSFIGVVSVAHGIIGSQTDDDLTDGVNDLIRCLGNVLLPPTVCKGTDDDDNIIGQGAETIYGRDGDDLIQGAGGPDVIFGGDDDDTIQGGEGTDSIFGNDGDDVLFGDSGTNIIFGAGGNSLFGGKGDDRLFGGSDNDVLNGGPGKDFFDCNEGADTVTDFDEGEGDTANANCEVLQ
jgi:Ca2+-binding RTX toxin-like protein